MPYACSPARRTSPVRTPKAGSGGREDMGQGANITVPSLEAILYNTQVRNYGVVRGGAISTLLSCGLKREEQDRGVREKEEKPAWG